MGQNSVGSLVVMQDGKPAPAQYRHFKIQTVVGPDDFASMKEVLGRRLAQYRKAELNAPAKVPSPNSFANLPDLIIIDGGKGQLSAAREAIVGAGLGAIPTFGLAKREEELFQPGEDEPIILPRESQSLFLVQRIRDEAHRFAITHHRGLRAKAMIRSRLDEVTGVGPAKKRALLQRFGDLQGIRLASPEELETVPGITHAIALRLRELL
jgi:excinuclease ABC subunit C